MVFEAMGGSQGWPGCRRGYRRDCPGYYTPEKVYILYTARVTAEGPGGGIGTAALVFFFFFATIDPLRGHPPCRREPWLSFN